MDPTIFITYSSKDEKVARTICTALENRGLACWISSRNVKPGQNYQEQIVRAIRAAKIMVLVFTANANNSNEIKKELALASQNNLVVIPVRIEDVAPNEAFAYEFATRQWLDLFDNWENSIARLVELIAAAVNDHPSGDRANADSGLTAGAAARSFGKITADAGAQAAAAGDERQKKPAKNAAWVLPAAVAAACVAVLVIAAFAYLKIVRPSEPQVTSQPQPAAPTVMAEPKTRQAEAVAPAAPAVTAEPKTRQAEAVAPTAPAVTAEPKTRQAEAVAPTPPAVTAGPKTRQAEALAPEAIPFISNRARDSIRTEYIPAPDHKALAISSGSYGSVTGQADDESAKTAALDVCQQRADALPQPRRCELYAVGNTVTYARGRPPMPPTPWFTRDPSIETPLVSEDVPLLGRNAKRTIEKSYLPSRKPKALAVASSGAYHYYFNQANAEQAARRALEACGSDAGVPCRIVAIDDSFVVPILTTMKPVGFFQPASADAVAPELRDDLARRLGTAAGGWTAVATGSGGRAGLMLKAASEQEAIDGALADCSKQDRSCHVIAIGPFAVEPK